MKLTSSIAVAAAFIGMAGITTWSLLRDHGSGARNTEMPASAPLLTVPGAIQPIPEESGIDPRSIALGKRLFDDTRLSGDGTISCSSCHDLAKGGVDGLAVPTGIGGAQGSINAPTVLNSRYNFKQFWDGRADSLEDQIDGPIFNVKEMGSSWPAVIERLKSDQDYVRDFSALYGDGITQANIKNVIAEFERSLVTPDSRFDRFLRGEKDALTADEQAGWQLFQEIGCTTCHQGVNLGGNMFQSFGVVGDYFKDRGNETPADLGRFNVTGKSRDKHVFKVPSLRNIELTAPYFHDAQGKSLGEAVQVMAKYQIGVALETDELGKVVAFLKTLTGQLRKP